MGVCGCQQNSASMEANFGAEQRGFALASSRGPLKKKTPKKSQYGKVGAGWDFTNSPPSQQAGALEHPGWPIPTVDHRTACLHVGGLLFATLLPNSQDPTKGYTQSLIKILSMKLIGNDIICSHAHPRFWRPIQPISSGSPWGGFPVSCCWGYACMQPGCPDVPKASNP